MSRRLLTDDPCFAASDVAQALAARPLGFVDVGARGGVQSHVDAIAPLAAVLAFEPDAEAVPAVRQSLMAGWQRADVEPVALGDRDGTGTLHLFASGMNHSLLPAAPRFRTRYAVGSLADVGSVSVTLNTLDTVLFGHREAEPFWGELLKLDVQGAELGLLSAAPRTLAERAVTVIAEVCFLDIYQDQPKFSELEQFLRSRGFTFYGFLSLQGWSQKYLDKRTTEGRERLCFGDAVFFKDPRESDDPSIALRHWQVLYVTSLLLGFVDFAIEVASHAPVSDEEAQRLVSAAVRWSRRGVGDAITEVQALLAQMQAEPEAARLHLGRFVDARRSLADVSDALLPRRAIQRPNGTVLSLPTDEG
ncbi:MAG: FkbM family methyltransferase [Alphaproteobacteria bacterium]|nr:FkbM family methyltransferase [Alphaproteobacteria bacterium]